MSDRIKILLADDHALVRDGLRMVIKSDSGLELIGEAENGKQAVTMQAELNPDVIVMDIDMPVMNGIEAVKEIRKYDTEVKIIILTMHEKESFLISALSTGINGYLYKMAGMDEFLDAIHSVYAGNEVFSQNFTKIISSYLRKEAAGKSMQKDDIYLSKREKEIIELIAAGKSNKQIAEDLFLSVFTIKNHRKNILHKLGLKNTNQLMRYAMENGYMPE